MAGSLIARVDPRLICTHLPGARQTTRPARYFVSITTTPPGPTTTWSTSPRPAKGRLFNTTKSSGRRASSAATNSSPRAPAAHVAARCSVRRVLINQTNTSAATTTTAAAPTDPGKPAVTRAPTTSATAAVKTGPINTDVDRAK